MKGRGADRPRACCGTCRAPARRLSERAHALYLQLTRRAATQVGPRSESSDRRVGRQRAVSRSASLAHCKGLAGPSLRGRALHTPAKSSPPVSPSRPARFHQLSRTPSPLPLSRLTRPPQQGGRSMQEVPLLRLLCRSGNVRCARRGQGELNRRGRTRVVIPPALTPSRDDAALPCVAPTQCCALSCSNASSSR